jgi:hypothetical protein
MNVYIHEKLAGTAATSTLQKRIPFLNGLAENINGFNNFGFLNKTGPVIRRIQKSDNIDTQWNSVWHVLMAIKSDPSVVSDEAKKVYEDLVAKLKPLRDAKHDNNVKNDKQIHTLKTELTIRQGELRSKIKKLFADNDLPYKVPTVAKLRKLNLFGFAKALQELIIPAVYLFQPALRNDWGSLNITTKMSGLSIRKNYLYVRGSTMRLIMNVYKNAKSLGHQVIDVRPELVELLQIWFAILKHIIGTKPSYPLLYNITKTKCEYVESEDALRRQIPRTTQRVFDIKDASGKSIGLSINDFRHLWEIDIQTNPNYAKMTLEERKKIHLELLHGTEIAMQYNVQ